MNTTETNIPHVYNAQEISLMLGAFGASIASIIYSFKHIKSSSCLGSKCEQIVTDVPVVPVVPVVPTQTSNI